MGAQNIFWAFFNGPWGGALTKIRWNLDTALTRATLLPKLLFVFQSQTDRTRLCTEADLKLQDECVSLIFSQEFIRECSGAAKQLFGGIAAQKALISL